MVSDKSRQKFMKETGHIMKNVQWSWSGVNHDNKSVMATTWTHYKNPENNKQYLVFHSDWGMKGKDSGSRAGRNEAIENLRLVAEEGYQLKIVFAEPSVKFSYPNAQQDEEVSIKKLRTSFYFNANLVVENDCYFAHLTDRVNVES